MRDAGLIGGAGNQFIVDRLESLLPEDIAGDVLEIGVFTGATTRALAEWAQKRGKRVVAVDPFDPALDGERAPMYLEWLNGKTQYEMFTENVEGLPVDVCMQTSRDFFIRHALIGDTFCAAVIDGSHIYDDVMHDLGMVWNYLNRGGIMLVHDYRHDIPDVTRAVDEFNTFIDTPADFQILPQFVMAEFRKVDVNVA